MTDPQQSTPLAFASSSLSSFASRKGCSSRLTARRCCKKRTPVTRAALREFRARDGISLLVDVCASPSPKATALFIHDFMIDHHQFDDFFQDTSDGAFANYGLVRYDIRGFGKSDNPIQPYSRVEDIDDILDSLDLGNQAVHVVGCGMGGAVGLEYAIARAGRILSVTCVSSGLPGHPWSSTAAYTNIADALKLDRKLHGEHNEYLAAENNESAKDIVGWKRKFISNSGTWGQALSVSSESVQRKLLNMAKDYRGFHFFQKDPLVPEPCDRDPLMKRLHLVQCPVFVLVGEGDTSDFKTIAQEIHDGVAKSVKEPLSVPDATHFPTLENPKMIADELFNFWEGLEGDVQVGDNSLSTSKQ